MQGDLLSPFLFILLVEGLGRTCKARQEMGDIKGIGLHAGMNPQTHQQFMEDTMLMGAASVREARAIKNTLDTFKQVSGLKVNKGKSHIFFFNTHSEIRRNINRILGFMEGALPSKYLGAPLLEGKDKQRN